ncbi:MAG: hypothetical protein ABSA58_08870 [Acetobacteraceae bacterium]
MSALLYTGIPGWRRSFENGQGCSGQFIADQPVQAHAFFRRFNDETTMQLARNPGDEATGIGPVGERLRHWLSIASHVGDDVRYQRADTDQRLDLIWREVRQTRKFGAQACEFAILRRPENTIGIMIRHPADPSAWFVPFAPLPPIAASPGMFLLGSSPISEN